MTCSHTRPQFGCDGCLVQRDFGPPAQPLPSWYRPSKDRKTQNHNVARGLHPMGLALHPDESKRCGGCAHVVTQGWTAGKYLKCDAARITRGPATDIRAKWRACEKWERNDIDKGRGAPAGTT